MLYALKNVCAVAVCATLSVACFASGSGGGGVTAPNSAEVRTLNERAPAGGAVQVKHLLTQPRPITSGGWEISAYGFMIDGIAVNSSAGDAIGVGVLKNGKLTLNVVSPLSDFGMNLDYPFITLTMDIPSTVKAGSTYTLELGQATVASSNGPLTLAEPKPGVLTIGGSVSVRGVYPGGGSYPAGAVITVLGTGFQPGTKISTKMKTTQPTYISPNEMRFTLTAPATLDQQPLQVTNPDGSQVTYYSYLRGVPVRPASLSVLQAAEPVFGLAAHAGATFRASACAYPQALAIALQNPNPWSVSVSLTDAATGTISIETLPSGGRLINTVAGDVTVSATSPIQSIGLCADDAAFTVVPFSPEF